MPGRESIMPGDGGDPAMPELVQMAHGRDRAALVVGHHDLGARALELHVDADAGHLGAREPAHLGVVGIEPDQRAAVDVVVTGALEVGVRAVAAAGRSEANSSRSKPSRADALLEPAEHLVEERVLQVRMALARLHEHADDVRALGDERAGRGGGRVVELAGEAHDALARLGTHVGVAVERP